MLLYEPQYCIASVVATLILILMYFMKRNYSTKHNKIFLIMLVDNLLASAINILTFYVITFPERHSVLFNTAVNIIYLILYNFMGVLFLLYVDSLTKIKKARLFVTIMSGFIIVYDVLLLLTTYKTHLIIYFDENLVYRHGPLMMSLYVTAFVAVVCTQILFFLQRRKFNSYQVFAVSGFIIGVFASIIFQMIFPRYVISNFTCAMTLFFIYTAFENQAYYLFNDTLCYNQRAFHKTIARMAKRRKPYVIIAVKYESKEESVSHYGRSGMGLLSMKVAERLCAEFRRKSYNVYNNLFVIVSTHDSLDSNMKERINKCFNKPFEVVFHDEILRYSLVPKTTVISVSKLFPFGYELVEFLRSADAFSRSYTSDDALGDALVPIKRERSLVRRLERALDQKEFKVYYQPILNVYEGKYTCAEALVRLYDEEEGFINPEEFIRVAERNGLIDEIGTFVFEEVCRFIRDSRVEDLGVHYIEINLSPKQTNKEELVLMLKGIMDKYNISPSFLNLEITETAEIGADEMKGLGELMTNLKEQGLTFSLDDFGSGFAAIDYLIQLPVEIVKIDKMILWNAMEDPSSMAVLRNTMSMISEVGKKVLVEGVETKEMADILVANGCDYMQGYLYSRPLPEDEYIVFLNENKDKIVR
ncbi:MAG: EAL domain-containing protein [Lachnospiraceae bacterium]|nr:EAL domain-containing protein [Lachnospiraceae bacterium]